MPGLAGRAPHSPRRGGPTAGGTCGGRLGDREKEGGEDARGSGRRTRGPQPLPCLTAPPWARGLGLPRSVPGAGTGGREGERRAALCNRRSGGASAARARRAEGDTGTDPCARPRGAAGARQVCACPGHPPPPRTCASVCLSVCASVSVSVTWGLRCRHNTGPPGRAFCQRGGVTAGKWVAGGGEGKPRRGRALGNAPRAVAARILSAVPRSVCHKLYLLSNSAGYKPVC